MKKLAKQICIGLVLSCTLLSCNQTEEINTDAESSHAKLLSTRCSVNNGNLSNALWFDSIAEANALLREMQSIDNAENFYNTYIDGFCITNKYINSIHEYLCLLEKVESGDVMETITQILNNKNGMFNIIVNGNDTIIEPLSYFDYRCLVNQDGLFVVDNIIYQLFDSVFITYPIDKYEKLIEIIKNPCEIAMLVNHLNTDSLSKSYSNEMFQRSTFEYADIANSIDVVNTLTLAGKIRYTFEKIVDKHRMQVIIDTEEDYVKFYDRHDLKTEYKIKSHKKNLGIWWVKNEDVAGDLYYEALFTYGSNSIEVVPHRIIMPMEEYYDANGMLTSYDRVWSYPYTEIPYIANNGIINYHFTLSNAYLTITENDLINVENP